VDLCEWMGISRSVMLLRDMYDGMDFVYCQFFFGPRLPSLLRLCVLHLET
jgi:hypothetical protein